MDSSLHLPWFVVLCEHCVRSSTRVVLFCCTAGLFFSSTSDLLAWWRHLFVAAWSHFMVCLRFSRSIFHSCNWAESLVVKVIELNETGASWKT